MNESVVFNAAVNLPKEQRAAFLDAACAGNLQLRAELEGLLREHDGAGRFMDRPAAQPPATTDLSSMHRPGVTIAGRFKLLEQIGEGGMGAVWVAEQTEPVRRRVALKLIKPGMDTKQVLSRFAAERQALALMDHPNIAKVYDGGMTEEGRPFFVMEYVKGVPITDYCDQAKLPIEERLKLFLPICQAVQHAHQKGIIHRDLKPSNLLVCLYDGQPVPKVIDFGLAKAISQPLTEHTLYTAHGLMVGTPLYMSPEQAEFNNLDVDTRTDIYSLGVILYELLTGTTPLEKQKFKDAAFQEILRLIKEEEPPKPSTKLSGSASLPAIAAQRGLEPAQLSRVVRGELDWIVMKALEKERSRRYETANGLTRDLERYLHDEPVEACPPSLGYKFSKFARRNSRALVTTALFSVVVVSALVTVAGSIGWALRDRETRQAVVERKILLALDKAEAAYKQDKLAEAQAAVHQAEGLLASADPRPEVAERFRQWLTDLAMVDLLEKIHLEKAGAVKEEHFDTASAAIPYAKAFQDYGLDLAQIGPLDAAQKLQTAPIRKHLLAALDDWAFLSDDAQRMKLLNIARQADSDPWRNQLRIALETRNAAGLKELAAAGDRLSQSPVTLALLADQLFKLGERPAAAALLRRAQGPYPNDFWINQSLGNLLLLESKADEAAIYLRIASAKSPNSPVARNSLGVALAFSNKAAEATEEYRAAIRLKSDFAMPHYNLASLLIQQGKLNEAETSSREAVRLRPADGLMHAGLADCLSVQGKFADAEKSYLEALSNAPDDWQINDDYVALMKTADRLLPIQKNLRQRLMDESRDSRLHRLLGDVLRRSSDLSAAESEYREAIRLNANDATSHTKLGAVLIEQGKLSEAESVLRDAVRIEPEFAWAQFHLGAALSGQRKWTDSEEPLRKFLDLNPNELMGYLLLTSNLRTQNKSAAGIQRPNTLELAPRSAGSRQRAYFKGMFELGTTYRTSPGFTEREMAVLSAAGILFGSGPPASTATRGSTASEAQLRTAIQRNPNDWVSRERLGSLLIGQSSAAAATAMWEAICADPTNYKFHAYLGVANRVNRDYSEAALQESIRLNPNYTYAHRHLAWALEGQGKYSDALAAIRAAIRVDPTDAENHHILAWFLAKHGELEAAEAAYREELKLRPVRAQSHNDFALVLHRAGKTTEAAIEFGQAREQGQVQFSSHANVANQYASNSLLWHAAHHYQAAIAQDPADSESASRAALLLLFQGDRSGYERLCRQLLDRFGPTKSEVDVHRVVQTCLITPEIVGDLATLTRLADHLPGKGDLSVISPRDRGLVAYRNSNWDVTLRWCRASRAENARIMAALQSGSTTTAGNETLYNAQNFILEAMALHQQGKPSEARKAYEMGARLGSGYYPFAPHSVYNRWKEWLTYEFHRREAADLLAIQDDSDWPLSLGRGRALAGAGDWKAGAAELARGCESPAANSLDFIAAGTALARADDREGFRKHCQVMIERFGGTGEWNEIERTVKICALAPYDVKISSEMLAAVGKDIDEAKIEPWLAAWGNTARAHAAYRKGRYDQAAEWADNAANERNANRHARTQGYLISAVANHRRGDTATAKQRLASALEWCEREPLPKLPDGSVNERLLVMETTGWWDVLTIEMMRHEAITLLGTEAKSPPGTNAAAGSK